MGPLSASMKSAPQHIQNEFRLQFLGANGTVTGSRYLVHAGGRRILVDCGLFQGYKPLRLRNWAPFPVDPASIDAVVLTHAHLDHSGYLPRFARSGFKGPVWCTHATKSLCGILLPDSGRLLEEEAGYANDAGEILDWLHSAPRQPRGVFVTHGEPDAANALRGRIQRELGWTAHVPKHLEYADLA